MILGGSRFRLDRSDAATVIALLWRGRRRLLHSLIAPAVGGIEQSRARRGPTTRTQIGRAVSAIPIERSGGAEER